MCKHFGLADRIPKHFPLKHIMLPRYANSADTGGRGIWAARAEFLAIYRVNANKYTVVMPEKWSSIRHFWGALACAIRAWLNPDTPRDAAAISYFSLITMFPAILVLIAMADAFLDPALHNRIVRLIGALFPGSRSWLRSNLSEISTPSPALVLSCVLVVIWASTLVFTFVENALNRAWGVPKRRTFLESRLRSISLLAMGGILLIISAGFTAVVSSARLRAAGVRKEFANDQLLDWLQSSILLGAGFLLVILVFAVTFKLMPDKRVSWAEAFPGAIVSSVSWEIAVSIFIRLVPHFDYQKIYGQTAAIITLLVWVYTSSLIMLFGANFSAQLHRSEEHTSAERQQSIAANAPSSEKIRRFPRSR
jgi:membrane protein